MRWKLLIITSFVAALLNAAAMHAFSYWLATPFAPLSEQPLLSAILVIIPLVFGSLAGIFVYRHTARRRKLQTTLTALFSLLLTLLVLYVAAETYFRLRPPAADSSPVARRR